MQVNKRNYSATVECSCYNCGKRIDEEAAEEEVTEESELDEVTCSKVGIP